ncbi:MAG TPA: type II secretion system protein GspC [Steroidobacteraceae bacterium]
MTSATIAFEELKSVQDLTRLFAERGAQLVALLLLLALGLDSALILTRALGSAPAVPPPRLATGPVLPGQQSVNPALQLATIVNAHLFGAAPNASGVDAPNTTMPLTLAGVIADPDPSKGVAIIGENAAAGKLYTVGAALPGGVHLHSVYGDRVLLERNGGLETLMLPRTVTPSRGAPAPAGVTPSAARGPVNSREAQTLLAGLVRIQPVFNQGKLTGYRVFPGGTKGNSAFTQLGLRPGDLIEAVNGTALDDAARAMEVLNTLGSSASATITVSRNNQSQEINLNLANLNLEEPADSGAAAPAEPAAASPPMGSYHGRGPIPNPSTAPGNLSPGNGTINAVPGSDSAAPSGPGTGGSANERDR